MNPAVRPVWACGSRASASPDKGRLNRGFTLIELLVVVALIAIATATVSLALRDPAANQLEREGERLVALFETARVESRTAGVMVQWVPVQASNNNSNDNDEQFRFIGLPGRVALPHRWLGQALSVEIANGASVRLGPEPMIGAQQVRLHLGSQQITLATDGLSPFEITSSSAQQ